MPDTPDGDPQETEPAAQAEESDIITSLQPEKSGRVLPIVGAVLITAGGLALALYLGGWAYEVRKRGLHAGRLERLLAQKPRLELVLQGFENEGTRLVGSADGGAAVAGLAERWGGRTKDVVIANGTRWPRTRVFLAGDTVYFVYFDVNGKMAGFNLGRP